MIIELKIAANWITQKINDNLISAQTGLLPPEVTQAQIDKFCMELFNAMLDEFSPDWDYRYPLYFHVKRAIRIHNRKNESKNNCINDAMEISGLTYQSLLLHELNFDLVINPGCVFYEQEDDFLYDKGRQLWLDIDITDKKKRKKNDNAALARVYAWKYEDCRVRRNSI